MSLLISLNGLQIITPSLSIGETLLNATTCLLKLIMCSSDEIDGRVGKCLLE